MAMVIGIVIGATVLLAELIKKLQLVGWQSSFVQTQFVLAAIVPSQNAQCSG